MSEFKRWQTWIWANWKVAAFIDWLKNYIEIFSADKRIGFYGLDVYSFRESMESIIQCLEKNDAETLKVAQKAMVCYEPYSKDEGQTYARASAFVPKLCEKEILDLLTTIIKKAEYYFRPFCPKSTTNFTY